MFLETDVILNYIFRQVLCQKSMPRIISLEENTNKMHSIKNIKIQELEAQRNLHDHEDV